MSCVLALSDLLIDPTQYVKVKMVDGTHRNIPKDFNTTHFENISIVQDSKGNLFLRSKFQINSDESQKNFFRDIAFRASCDHPLISKLIGFSFFTESGKSSKYLTITEFPENGFLSNVIERPKEGLLENFNNLAKSKIIFGIAIIGYYIHSMGIKHRGFTASSFGLTKKFDPILLVLSTSKDDNSLKTLESTIQTQMNSECLAPEFFSEVDYVGKEADVYSFGTIIYYLFTGKVPFIINEKGAKNDYAAIYKRKSNYKKYIPNDMPIGLRDLLEKCWKINPEDRPTFSEIIADLQEPRCLFPGVKFKKYNKYVQQALSKYMIKKDILSQISMTNTNDLKNALLELDKYVVSDRVNKYNTKVLNSISFIKEKLLPYKPIFVKWYRGDSKLIGSTNLPPFMHCCTLNKLISIIPDTPALNKYLNLEIDNNRLVNSPYLTLEKLGIHNGSEIRVYNSLINESFEEKLLNLTIVSSNKPNNILFSKMFSIKYFEDDTLQILFDDIHFLTRIPLKSINLKHKNKYLDATLHNLNKSLKVLGIHTNDTIEIEIKDTYDNINVEVDIVLANDINEKYDSRVYKISPLSKIADILNEIKISFVNFVITSDGKILSPYKSFIDYFSKNAKIVLQLETK